jgi:hypothetical protein
MIGFIGAFFTITSNYNSSQSVTSYDSLRNLLDYECLFFQCDRLGSDLRFGHCVTSRLPHFPRESVHRWRWDQPYAPAAFYHLGRFLVLISVRDWVDPRVIVRLERLVYARISIPSVMQHIFLLFSFTFSQHNMFRPYMAIFRCLNLSKLPHCN